MKSCILLVCLLQLASLVLGDETEITVYQVDVEGSAEFLGPMSTASLNDDGTVNAALDINKDLEPSAGIAINCFTKNDDGEYKDQTGINFRGAANQYLTKKPAVTLMKGLLIDPEAPKKGNYKNKAMKLEGLPTTLKVGDYQCKIVLLPSQNAPDSLAHMSFTTRLTVE